MVLNVLLIASIRMLPESWKKVVASDGQYLK